jgi:hypothetical protein
VRQGIFVNLFKEPGAERIGDGERASNDTLRNFIETFAVGVHRRLSFFLAWGPYRGGRIGRGLTADERR